ncbi:DUF1569 domain-containing protein [Gymnodinialimonas hymeniacidonis]|uniref:DUF1569 domain-containing protein n=1 Tax=Gymnodinialimonas hymeniacidonis TaxID=3126508 RepID=UPI0034C6B5D0
MTQALDTAFRRLDALDLSAIQSTGDWDLGRTFSHLAQGVEFSMTGYPEEKPKLFQMTAGKLAFTVFKLRGRMSHGLDEPIPGEVIGDVSADVGLHRLVTSLEQFRDHTGPLRPHFAFGALGKDQFALAHLMHIENHLEEVRVD